MSHALYTVDIMLQVFDVLCLIDKIRLSSVCRAWKGFLSDPCLWRHLRLADHPIDQYIDILKFYRTSGTGKHLNSADLSLDANELLCLKLRDPRHLRCIQTAVHLLVVDGLNDDVQHLYLRRTFSSVVGLEAELSNLPSPLGLRFTRLTHLDLRACFPAYVSMICGHVHASLRSFKVGWRGESHFEAEHNEAARLNWHHISSSGLRLDHLEQFWAPACFNLALHRDSRALQNPILALGSFLRDLCIPYVHMSDMGCSVLAAHFGTNLRELNLRANSGVGDAGLGAIASCCTQLRRINLGCTGVSLKSAKDLVANCPRLVYLDLCYCSKISEQPRSVLEPFLRQVAERLPRLRMIGVGGFAAVSDVCMSAIISRLPSLDHIGIGGMPHLGARSLEAVGVHCPALTDLSAHRMGPEFTFELFRDHIIARCPNLLAVDVTGCSGFSKEEIEMVDQRYNHVFEDW